ncbi:hypothetical protein IL306_011458 [Fusarium sp. DS 682]|nr:hypothetical protein IL306_011458 [Fusarium sp. DS 682]
MSSRPPPRKNLNCAQRLKLDERYSKSKLLLFKSLQTMSEMEGIVTTQAVVAMDITDPDPLEHRNENKPAFDIKKPKPTLQIRENLLYWKCNQTLHDGSMCGSYNELNFKQCKDCKSRRGVGDDGTDAYGTKIAKIVFVNNKNGEEFWQYVSEE